ncbi:restriction endonuclease subunit S [Marinobacter sp.]|uniref:restriction endonuclease subunit S n=1 Tax=Marinobacter sp. TaxID=50741 RepID=UPI00356736B4
MSSNWPRVAIRTLIEEGIIKVHKDGNHGSKYPRAAEFGNTGVPFLTAKSVDETGDIDFENAPRLAIEKANTFTFGFIEADDVLLSHNATVGRVAIVPQIEERVLIGTSLTHFRLDTDRLLPRYLAAYFSGRDFQNQLASVMSQSTRNQVPITSQRKLTIILPPIENQKVIADALGYLDSKRRLNHQINRTLEKIGQTTFKSWFVDFEPVKAKIATLEAGGSEEDALLAAMQAISGKGKAQLIQLQAERPGRYAELRATAELFPSVMQDSELGEIPEGWEANQLGEYLDTLETGARPKGGVSGISEGVPSIGAENILGVGNYNYGKEKFITVEFFNKLKRGIVEHLDCLLYKDGGKPGDFKPRVSMFGCGFPYDKLAINEHVYRLRSQRLGQPFLYFQIGHDRVLADLRHKGAKAAIPGINQTDVKTIWVACPPKDVLLTFNTIATKIVVSILNRSKENLHLSDLRNTLLPQLLSGALTVDARNNEDAT